LDAPTDEALMNAFARGDEAAFTELVRRHGVALIRIDRILTGQGTAPTAFDTDCTFRGSDHCVLHATVAVGR
jgi:hypothetical protein